MSRKWTRETPWRQGSTISHAAALSLGLLNSDSAEVSIPLVVSHDCDIVEDSLVNEPNVEIIVGRYIDEAEPNFTHSKSPNRLHLEMIRGGRPQFIELLATEKRSVGKQSLAEFEPDPDVVLSSSARDTLQAWLASRYRRASFPDSLNSHLRLLRPTLQDIGKKNPKAVIGFYVYYEPEHEITDHTNPYEVWIVVVYDHKEPHAKDIAQTAVAKIVKRIEEQFKTGAAWRGIELRECEIASDQEFSLYSAMTFKSYPLEYLSLRPG